MKSKMRWRHYCDHCSKSMGTKPAMVKHEARCTMNPGRVCSMCDLSGEVQAPISELMTAYGKGFNALREACNNCPACTLATIRQFDAARDPDDFDGWDHPRNTERGDWDFKADCKSFWESWNKDQAEHQYF